MPAIPGRVKSPVPVPYTIIAGIATGAAPTLATDGDDLSYVDKGYRITVSTDDGQSLSGSGTVDCYYYNEAIAAWSIAPWLVIDLSQEVTQVAGKRAATFDFEVVGPQIGRVKYVPNAVGASGGVNVSITIELRTTRDGR